MKTSKIATKTVITFWCVNIFLNPRITLSSVQHTNGKYSALDKVETIFLSTIHFSSSWMEIKTNRCINSS